MSVTSTDHFVERRHLAACMHACMHAQACLCMHAAHACACMYASIHASILTCTFTHACTYTYIHALTRVYICTDHFPERRYVEPASEDLMGASYNLTGEFATTHVCVWVSGCVHV